MSSRDMHNIIKPLVALKIAAISSNTTTVGEIIDTQNFESLEFVFQTGTTTDGDYVVLIEDGDDSGLSDAADVVDDALLGTETLASFTADTDDDKTSKIGYIGAKRFVRLSIVSTNVTTGGTFGAIAILGKGRTAQQTDQTP